jgi:predicted aspartyl protease
MPLVRLIPVAICLAAPLAAQESPAALKRFQEGLATVDILVDRFYRGESVDAERARVNAAVDRFNALVDERDKAMVAVKASAERVLAPANVAADQVNAMDRELKNRPDPSDGKAVDRYNERVRQRNLAADRYADLRAEAKRSIDAFDAQKEQNATALDRARAILHRDQEAFRARLQAYQTLQKDGDDVRLFEGLNGLLAGLRREEREGRNGPGVQAAIRKARSLRRELAQWAMAAAAADENGLVLVEAMVGDEPCCFIVDTGAMLTTLSPEVVSAAGLADTLGKEATLVLVGGTKIQGRTFTIARLAVAGMEERRVSASAVPPSEVGIDGLLGQSFLKRFHYGVDETRPEKLALQKR